jgi:hypothetical protein
MRLEASPLGFVRAFGSRWFSTMSGGLSVPLAAAGYHFTSDNLKLGFYFLALLCILVSSYSVWRIERLKVKELSIKLAPNISIQLNTNDIISTKTQLVRQIHNKSPHIEDVLYIRLKIKCLGASNLNASAYITDIFQLAPGGGKEKITIHHPLAIKEKFDVLSGIDAVIDVLYINILRNQMLLCGYSPLSPEAFRFPAEYIFVISVNAGTITETIDLRVVWSGQWNTVAVSNT